MRATGVGLVTLALVTGCRAGVAPPRPDPRGPSGAGSPAVPVALPDRAVVRPLVRVPSVPPHLARMFGWMPLRATGVDVFRHTHPTYDGRGVLIAILDSGVDPHASGLSGTSAGDPKIVDIRDFSDEGLVGLTSVLPPTTAATRHASATFDGLDRIRSRALGGLPWHFGVIEERAFGPAPGGDLNGDGDARDVFGVVVVRASYGWIAYVDCDGDWSFADEEPIRDYAAAQQTFTFAVSDAHRDRGPHGVALNIAEQDGRPTLRLVVDNSGHGTHVAGVAAGFEIGGEAGLDGVAPGAQLLALKIANNARGGVSVSGSMVSAMEYAVQYAARRRVPLVLNLSYGVGNEREGHAVIDSIIDALLDAHPRVVLTIAAGNDGPGVSTVGFPGSAEQGLSVGAVYPGVFTRVPRGGVPPGPDRVASFSARGGELAKPDLVAPGVAYSTVPHWNRGEEVQAGTSMSAPYVAGMAAVLIGAAEQDARPWSRSSIKDALIASGRPLPDMTALDQGAGMPHVGTAWRYLAAHKDRPSVRVWAEGSQHAGALRRHGLLASDDTVQNFVVAQSNGDDATLVLFSADPWLSFPPRVTLSGGRATVPVYYHAARMPAGSMVTGTVRGWLAGDTTGAPAFRLLNTVVRLHDLASEPLVVRRRLVAAGALARYFVRVPADAGGLDLSLDLVDPRQSAELFLFEPDGRPFRGDSVGRLAVGGAEGDVGTLRVRADDVIPGVYEIVVVAPLLEPAIYHLLARLAGVDAPVRVTSDTVHVSARRASVEATRIGAVQRWLVEGRGDEVRTRPLVLPPGVRALQFDVTMAPQQWERFTDLAVVVYGDDGVRLDYATLDYAFGRKTIALGDGSRNAVTLEVFPALALPRDPKPWSLTVVIRALEGEPRPLRSVGAGRFVLDGGAAALPAAWRPLVETVARTRHGAPSVRWTEVAAAGEP